MRRLLLAGAMMLASVHVASAATVCAILSNDQTAVVLGPVNCSDQFSPAAVSIDTGDTRWTTYTAGVSGQLLGLRYQRLFREQILSGIALTSTGNSSLNGTYSLFGTQTTGAPGPLDNFTGLFLRAETIGTNFAGDGGSTESLYDVQRNAHVFDSAHMISFGNAISHLLHSYSFQAWATGGQTFPANTETIP